MPNKPDFPLRVFYDGSCIVCAAEIEHYLKLDHGGRLQAIDISVPEFDPELFHIPLSAFMFELHAIDGNNRIYRGVEAFIAIWQAFPVSMKYSVLSTIVTMPLINHFARLLYRGFARMRAYLPKKHDCTNGACRINKTR
ncbi:MAG: DUF393 domain-containing protein [Desulfuromonadaceae bacterium]|nr:DUF393 domain-containing protein [Desulfuromonadaceae bacterium]